MRRPQNKKGKRVLLGYLGNLSLWRLGLKSLKPGVGVFGAAGLGFRVNFACFGLHQSQGLGCSGAGGLGSRVNFACFRLHLCWVESFFFVLEHADKLVMPGKLHCCHFLLRRLIGRPASSKKAKRVKFIESSYTIN